ncbi:hypothetical protein J1C56_01765 [Aminobacter anthyllidis]|uniref:Uncharacterized protein n=1 Tax=Aminobacter anthyllidis TaxID=1035067 RepID=A0A9X1A6L5_9HYPH|nr:hypothetical protein [Aminobacter anthyllidis]MBT1154311.1 hypothetical protein [Aminobacter anthyllidis]
MKPYITFWWRKATDYTVDDDVRFVAAHYRAGGPWTVRRIVYRLASRTGIVVRLGLNRPCYFIGFMTLTDRTETNEPSPGLALQESKHD